MLNNLPQIDFYQKYKSESNPLAPKSICQQSSPVIHHNKPDHVGYQEPKGFLIQSTFGREKGYITITGNFWTHCRSDTETPASGLHSLSNV